jgi:hypothetical protein
MQSWTTRAGVCVRKNFLARDAVGIEVDRVLARGATSVFSAPIELVAAAKIFFNNK